MPLSSQIKLRREHRCDEIKRRIVFDWIFEEDGKLYWRKEYESKSSIQEVNECPFCHKTKEEILKENSLGFVW